MNGTPERATAGTHFHAVRFYEDDRSLCRIVAEFIGDGLAAGQPAVVIAVPPHRELICEELAGLAFDVGHVRESGQLILLDAEATLSTFMNGGAPDGAAFRKSVGAVLDSASKGAPHVTVRAYGEMVDWLWKHDATESAIQLEVLWNQLATTKAFSLLCGYSMGNFYKHGAYETICAQHNHVMSASGQVTSIGVS